MPKYYVGVDWGKSKCGIALADEENKIATGYKTVLNGDLLETIKTIDKETPIRKIIVGLLEAGENIKAVENFKKTLEKEEFKVEMEREDFSSLLAQTNLKEAGKKNISKMDDAEAARIILQSWLDKKS